MWSFKIAESIGKTVGSTVKPFLDDLSLREATEDEIKEAFNNNDGGE